MSLGALETSLLGNLLAGKEVNWSKIPGQGLIESGEGTNRAGEGKIKTGKHF